MPRAIRIEKPGGPEVMTLGSAPEAAPGPEDALVRVEAAGVNFIDTYHRTGLYPVPTPFTPGVEGAGVVEAVGSAVSDLAPGDRVGWVMQLGSYAEQAVRPAAKLVRLPESVTTTQAAAALLQGMTAHYLVRSTFRVQSGMPVLVHAAAGGMGLLLCQMCRALGARVFGTVSTEAKAQAARAAGADHVIRYTEQDFAEVIREELGDKKLAVAYDSVGETTWRKSLGLLRPRGMLVLYGQSSGPVPPIDPAAAVPKRIPLHHPAHPRGLRRDSRRTPVARRGSPRQRRERQTPPHHRPGATSSRRRRSPPSPRGPRHHRKTHPPPVARDRRCSHRHDDGDGLERRPPVGTAAHRLGTPVFRPAQRPTGPRKPRIAAQPHDEDGWERRPPAGIARERETSAGNAAPYRRKARMRPVRHADSYATEQTCSME